MIFLLLLLLGVLLYKIYIKRRVYKPLSPYPIIK